MIDPSIDQGKLYELKRRKLSTDVPTSSPPVAPDSGWKSFPKSEIPKMFNEGHIYHHLVESLQGTGEGSDLDECDNIDLDSNTSKPTLAFFAVHARLSARMLLLSCVHDDHNENRCGIRHSNSASS